MSITTALVGLMLATATGAAFDTGRQVTTSQKLQSISDAAALAAMSEPGMSDRERKAMALRSVNDFAKRSGAKYADLQADAQVRAGGEQVYVSVATEVPMLFGGLMGSDTRRVSTESIAAEFTGGSLSPLSMSFVLDLSSSMQGNLGGSSKVDMTRSAIADLIASIEADFGGKAASQSRFSSALYPFNWGMVDTETVALEPGGQTVLDRLSYVSLSDGSVPTTAMERAVKEQMDDAKSVSGRDRFIIYITDGKVDEDKDDRLNRYLREDDIFEAGRNKNCEKLAKTLARLDRQLEPHLVEVSANASALSVNVAGLVNVNLGDEAGGNDANSTGMHSGHGHNNGTLKKMAKRLEARRDYVEQCRPVQPVRVAEACEKAREEDISIVAVNLSGEDGIASNTIDMCVNGLSNNNGKVKKGAKTTPDRPDSGTKTKTLPSGLTVRISSDETSYSADVRNLKELREMLNSVLPEASSKRTVRLVR
ncbi:pilus assembly protein TadG-related protein [Algimonas porphyrae]